MNTPEIHHDFILARHMHGVKLVAPESDDAAHSGMMSVADCMQLPVNIYFTDHTQVLREINDLCAHNCEMDSRLDVIGKTISCISRSQSIIDCIEQNNRDVMQLRTMKVFDELTDLPSGQLMHTLSVKLPWYDQNHRIQGIFGFAVKLGRDHLDRFSSLFSFTLNKLLLPLNSITDNHDNFHQKFFSSREREILSWVVRGKTMREIAEIIGLSRRTIESYFENIKSKLGVRTRSEVIDSVIDYFI